MDKGLCMQINIHISDKLPVPGQASVRALWQSLRTLLKHSERGGSRGSDNPIRLLPGTERVELINECMRNPGEITNGHKDLRAMEGIIILTKWWTDRLAGRQFKCILWNAAGLNLKVSRPLTITASTDGGGQKAGVSSLFDYWPFNLLWFHQTKLELHLWLPLCLAHVPVGNAFLCESSVEKEEPSRNQSGPLCFILGSGPKHFLHLCSKMAFILWPDVNEKLKLVLSSRRQRAGSILNCCRYWRQQTASRTLPGAHAVALSLSSHVWIHLSQLRLSCHRPVSLLHLSPPHRKKWFRKGSHLSGLSGRVSDRSLRWACSLICHKSHMTHRSPGAGPFWASWPHEHTCAAWPNLTCTNLHIVIKPRFHQKKVDVKSGKRYVIGRKINQNSGETKIKELKPLWLWWDVSFGLTQGNGETCPWIHVIISGTVLS